jgi:hypothetical protein
MNGSDIDSFGIVEEINVPGEVIGFGSFYQIIENGYQPIIAFRIGI